MGRMRYMGSKKTISKKKTAKPVGRPSKYSEALADKICLRIMMSTEGLHSICKDDGMPCPATAFNWLNEHKEFLDKYARAKEIQAELLADEIISIADTTIEGTKTKVTDRGTEIITGDMIEHRRLQVDARKWKASKLYPKRFGDKLDVTSKDGAIGKTSQIILPNGTTIEI